MVTILHVVGIFVSAFLLFLVQPMVARMLLPRFGGSPAVWNTCLLFFQAMLLGGYLYSHFVVRRLPTRVLLAVHAVVLLLPLALLPPLVGSRWVPSPDAWPVPMLLAALAATVGLPFFVLSTNSTLAQHWLLRHGREPYFLYSASNTGSLLALLGYPFIVEPALGLQGQARLFAGGYLAFVAITAVLMVLAVRRPDPDPVVDAASERARAPAPTLRHGLGWAFRAMVASSLLLAVTLRITLDVGAMPLLWVIPLSVYLLTFIIAFLPRFPYPRPILEILTMFFVTLGFATVDGGHELTPMMIVCMGVLFLGCWICHADLARDRPSPEHLTTFYLWISVGGVLGGLFGNLAAPLLFDSLAEFPLTLALLAIVLVAGDGVALPLREALRRRGTLVIGAIMLAAFAGAALSIARDFVDVDSRIPVMGVMLAGMVLWRRNKGTFAIAALLTSLFVTSPAMHGKSQLESRRSFFGVLRVREKDGERFMLHGTTIHGSQKVPPASTHPRFYFHPASPLAAAVRSAGDADRIAIIGLGSGALAVYTRAGQTLTYYEIDPIVEPMASHWFTFLGSAPAKISHVIGDARLTLDRVPDGSIDLLVVDAFSSDAIPVHLLTREAVEMFARKLAPNGRIAAHVSNRHLDIAPLLGAAAERVGLLSRQWRFIPTKEQHDDGASVCHAVMLARTEADFARAEGPWVELVPAAKDWTDDHSSLLDALK